LVAEFNMRDSEIEQWVLSEIRLRTDGRLKEVCVFSLNGVVNLKGTVPSRADKLATQEAVERAKGVIGVINQLTMRRSNLPRGRRAGVKSQVAPASGTFQFLNHKPANSSHVAS
jgi:osmotically-inducible protein OsmY